MNATSIAAVFLTTEAVIADKPEDDDGGTAGMDDFWSTLAFRDAGVPMGHPFRVYGRLNVTWVTPLGEDVASTS